MEEQTALKRNAEYREREKAEAARAREKIRLKLGELSARVPISPTIHGLPDMHMPGSMLRCLPPDTQPAVMRSRVDDDAQTSLMSSTSWPS